MVEETRNTGGSVGRKLLKPQSTKQQFSGVDTKQISNELSKMIEIADKKIQSSKSTKKKRITAHEKKFTAKDHNFQLRKDPKRSHVPIIDLFELSKKIDYTNSDVILAIIEIALFSDCYSIPYSFKSNHFWEEIVQYNELKRIFQFYRPETLKKYFRLINYHGNAENTAKIVKQHKNLLDDKRSKLLTIVSGAQNYLNKKITDFSDFILNHHKYINLGTPSRWVFALACMFGVFDNERRTQC